jgi:hypothetical protein
VNGVRLSIFTWSIYLLGMGLGLLLIPDSIVDLFGMDPAKDIWIRVGGVVAVVLGIYYLGSAIHRARWMFWYSVPVRIASGVALAVLAVTESVWQLWLFAALDIASAAWTFTALRFKPEPEPIEPSAVA